MMKVLEICFVLTILLTAALIGVDIEPHGFVDTYHAVRLKDPYDFISSRTRFREELYIYGKNSLLFASFNALYDNVLPDQTGIELRQAYLEYMSDNWDFRLGRQIIIWGKADGIQIIDIISPPDYTEFLARDFDDIRMPVDALKFRILPGLLDLEFIWIPFFKPAVLPQEDNPWAIHIEFPEGMDVTLEQTILPEKKFKNSEFAGKVSMYLSGMDFSLSAAYLWDDLPALHKTIIADTIPVKLILTPKHHRITFVGFDFAKPVKDFVLRGELAFFHGKYFEPQDISEELYKKNSINTLLGVDWYPGNDLMITAQFVDNYILDYEQAIKDDEHTMLTTLHISKKLFRQTLELSTMGYFGINEKDGFVRTNMDYALTDEIHLLCGVDLFFGDKGMMGQYNDNDEVWIKAKYSF
ncbi:hypothetical protein KAW96_06310 [candidate division WOR-3 bacterium]|nr:hypothetical protein [candidate division WOR-3 bacterium]